MKIIVFGATGGVGQFVVRQALDAGLEVTAFVRTPSKLDVSHQNLKVVKGDAFDQKDVTEAIAGHDAVVSCLGSSNGMKKSNELERMTKSVVEGMKINQVERIVYTASAGVHKELTGLSGKFVMALLKNALIDHRAAVDCIVANGFNYTIARPMGLTNESFSGKYRESLTGVPQKAKSIPRADVAHFIVKALTQSEYDRKSVGIAK